MAKPASIAQDKWDALTPEQQAYLWQHEAAHIYWQCFANCAHVTVEEVSQAVGMGMLSIDQLEHNQAYLGCCRNAAQALWDRGLRQFHIVRFKHGRLYAEPVSYPWPGEKFDVFVPVAAIEGHKLIGSVSDYITNPLN